MLRRDGIGSPDIRQRLEDLASRLDDRYLKLNEDVDTANSPETLRAFVEARALSGLALALSAEPEDRAEAIYEGIMASSNQGEAIHLSRTS